MLSRLFLAAGVAALAIAAPAYADRGGGHGGGGGEQHGGGGGGGPHGGGGGGPPAFGGGGRGGPHGGGAPHGGGGPPAFAAGGGPHGGGGPHWGGGAPAFAGGGGHGHFGGAGPHFAAPQMRAPQMHTFAHQQFRGGGGFAHQQFRMAQRPQGHGFARQQMRVAQQQQAHGFAHQQMRMAQAQQQHGRGFAHQQMRMAQGPQAHGFAHQQMRLQQAFAGPQQQFGGNGRQFANRQPGTASPQFTQRQPMNQQFVSGQQFGGRQFANQQFASNQYGGGWNATPYSDLTYANNVQVLPVQQVQSFIGVPVAQVAQYAALSPIPADMQYLYPETPAYYYQWGDGYLYQVDRSTNLIDALIPLLAGGFLPGEYLPSTYVADYVPSYYGLDNFYPDDGDLCNRYDNGVIYQVDCNDGYVEDVVPVYAGGYGVGQLLPTAYAYYNVPTQYRGLYYDTPQANYWYSPGAIYQYDPRTSVITSVAALTGPGFAIGQPLPAGYDVYNVPIGYRATYYDTPSAWYRYNNGYIYQVDPVTQLVTAIVASILT